MSLTNMLLVRKTIRFKLTLAYSVILLIFSLLIIVGFNLFLHNYLNREPKYIGPVEPAFMFERRFNQGTVQIFKELPQDEKQNIQKVRLNDLNNFKQASLLSLIPIGILSFILGYYLSGSFLSPIDELSHRFKEIEASKLGQLIPKETDDEVGRLIDSFNSMSTRLKGSFEEQQRFVQDAAHEIKTPLTIIQTSLDTTLSDNQSSKQELKEAMRDALDGVKRLRKLTNDLLDITTPYLLNERVNVKKVLNDQVGQLEQYAQSKEVTIQTNYPEKSIFITGNSIKLGRAIYNIIENGLKFSNGVKQPHVKISLKSEAQSVIIEIEDNGIGIPKKAQEDVFKRFYRARKSEEGNGLGLSIAKEIIEQHKGNVTLMSKPGETTFTISLPVFKG